LRPAESYRQTKGAARRFPNPASIDSAIFGYPCGSKAFTLDSSKFYLTYSPFFQRRSAVASKNAADVSISRHLPGIE